MAPRHNEPAILDPYRDLRIAAEDATDSALLLITFLLLCAAAIWFLASGPAS